MKRCHNFNAGPAVLPVPVLERIREEMLCLPGVGMSVLEISHRSKTFETILSETENRLRRLLNVPETHHILFLQGGASLQFSMVPLNFLTRDGVADYIVTGSWSEKAVEEARKIGRVNIAATTKEENYARIPNQSELRLDPQAAYVHFTSNNTIFGTQWPTEPEVGTTPLVCDASSDFLSRPLDVSQYALLYAGAQKNAGPAGVTIVIVREDWLERIPGGAADDARLPYACEASVAVQHAARLCHLRGGTGAGVSRSPAVRRCGGQCRKSREALCRHRQWQLLPGHGSAQLPFADERLFPAPQSGPGSGFSQGSRGQRV